MDFKNFKWDMLAYISGGNSQLVIDNFLNKQEISLTFPFDYDAHEYGQLSRLFWVDLIARKKFSIYGDVLSFDAMYPIIAIYTYLIHAGHNHHHPLPLFKDATAIKVILVHTT